MRKGIVAGGNLIVDNIKIIDYYPDRNMMANIIKEPKVSVGGCPHNVLVDISKLKVDIPLYALGLIGNDSSGDLVLKSFELNKIDTNFVCRTSTLQTSFTDAMIVKDTGERTFFHYGGANSELDFKHFVGVEVTNAKIFHLANLLHLDRLDSSDEEFGLMSAKVLKYLIDRGLKTSVDLVSVKSDLFPKIVQHCLKYVNYLIINELEAESLSGFQIRDKTGINFDNLKKTALFLIENGVNDLVAIHFPEGGYALDSKRKEYFEKSYTLEPKFIKSSVGAGDSFCSGILYSLHQDLDISQGLKIANACARFNLFDETATGGAQNLIIINQFIESKENLEA